MRTFDFDRSWSKREYEEYLVMLVSKIRCHTRDNPTSGRKLAAWCMENKFPKAFNRADTIRQAVSFLRRHKGEYIGSDNHGTWYIHDTTGWEVTMSKLDKQLRVLQATYSAMVTNQVTWYRERQLPAPPTDQIEMQL